MVMEQVSASSLSYYCFSCKILKADAATSHLVLVVDAAELNPLYYFIQLLDLDFIVSFSLLIPQSPTLLRTLPLASSIGFCKTHSLLSPAEKDAHYYGK